MTKTQAIDLVQFVIAAYPTQRQRMTTEDVKAMIASWFALLHDLDFEVVKAAVTRIGRTSKFIPSVAEIREAVGVVTNGSPRTGLEAWREVIAKIGSKGRDRTPGVDFQFSDPIIASIVTGPLWRELCESDNPTADRARFVEAYQRAQERERRDVQASPGAVAKALPAPNRQAVAQLEMLSGKLAETLGGRR